MRIDNAQYLSDTTTQATKRMTMPRTRAKYEIMGDGRTVWVNAADGCCVGRFSRWGIDVHHNAENQMTYGKQCLECTHTKPDSAAWQQFKTAMLNHHGVQIPERLRPQWLI